MRLRRFAPLLVAAAAACGGSDGPPGPLRTGEHVPDYAAVDRSGDTVSLAALRGSPVLVNVWATWCTPCREEMPTLQALHELYADSGLHVVGVSIDAESASAMVDEFLQDFGVTFLILRDPKEEITRTFSMNGVPETFLLDRRGRLVKRWIGKFDASRPEVRALVVQLLRGNQVR
jgi:cytochrome c biogenesis protein CcmG, thiol:disulfide interchange protein DsbE